MMVVDGRRIWIYAVVALLVVALLVVARGEAAGGMCSLAFFLPIQEESIVGCHLLCVVLLGSFLAGGEQEPRHENTNRC